MMLLADSAQVAEGKLYILGGGWVIYGPNPSATAIVIKMAVDPHGVGVEHRWDLFLEDADGRQVLVGPPDAQQPIGISGGFRAEVPEGGLVGTSAGDPVFVPLVVNFAPMVLPANSRFVWRFSVDGETPPGGVVAFSTRPEAL
jgi:hypothetical protein